MKKPIEWHENNLKNRGAYIKELRDTLKNTINSIGKELERNMKYYKNYEAQIREAKRLGKDGFDRNRFMKPKARNGK